MFLSTLGFQVRSLCGTGAVGKVSRVICNYLWKVKLDGDINLDKISVAAILWFKEEKPYKLLPHSWHNLKNEGEKEQRERKPDI